MNPTQTNLQPEPVLSQRFDHATLFAHLHKVPILSSLSEEDLHCLDEVEQIHLERGTLL